jgi:hypothetical protein
MSKGDFAFVKGSFSTTMVIMMIVHILVEEPLCQDIEGWSPVLESFPIRSA